MSRCPASDNGEHAMWGLMRFAWPAGLFFPGKQACLYCKKADRGGTIAMAAVTVFYVAVTAAAIAAFGWLGLVALVGIIAAAIGLTTS